MDFLPPEFCQRHVILLLFLMRYHPDYLEDLEEEFAQARLAATVGVTAATRAPQRDASTQVNAHSPLRRRGVDVGVQVSVEMTHRGTDTEGLNPLPAREEEDELASLEEPRPAPSAEQDLGSHAAAKDGRRTDQKELDQLANVSEVKRCWNCGSSRHFLDQCEAPRLRTFCYRCGRPGYTVMSCPRCGKEWQAQGSYRRDDGYVGGHGPQCTGKPPGVLKSPIRARGGSPR
ncbi:uncharacterized protein [Linepithema humile]|nr:PREDICTED: uncharacterized protein LOC105674286 [Linepithema humile]